MSTKMMNENAVKNIIVKEPKKVRAEKKNAIDLNAGETMAVTQEDYEKMEKNPRIRFMTRKSNLVRFAVFQFLGLLAIAIAIVVVFILTSTKTVDNTVTQVAAANPEPQIQIIEKEVPVEVPVEVEKEVIVEVEKEVVVEVVNTEEVERLAQEKATEMYTELRATYVAQADQELTEERVNEMFEALKAEYVAEANATEVERLASERAMAMFEEYKAEFVAEQEAALAAAVSTIRIYIYGGKENFYLYIEGQMYERLTYDKIYAALQADARFEGYKVNRITNKDAVEVFIGEDYTSTRTIRIELK